MLTKAVLGARDTTPGPGSTSAIVLAFVPELMLLEEEVGGLRRYFPEGDIRCGAYIVMRTAQAVWQPGWLASQADMLAEDWFVLPGDAP